MTTPADASADERAFAACLTGRPAPDGALGLAAFTAAVRESATVPGRPNAALAELLATGLLVPTQEPSLGTAGRPARDSRKRTRMLIPALVAKFVAAGATAKAAAGAGVVAVALAGATTATVVTTPEEPAPVVETTDTTDTTGTGTSGGDTTGTGTTEDGVTDTTGGDVTSVDITDTTGSDTTGTDTTGTDTTGTGTPTTEEQAGTDLTPEQRWEQGPTAGQSHGEWVSEGARQGWVDGATVSGQAHERNGQRKADRAAAPVTQEPAEESVEGSEAAEAEDEVEQPEVEEPAEPAGEEPRHGNGKGRSGK